jgi:hypothetical protein
LPHNAPHFSYSGAIRDVHMSAMGKITGQCSE